MRAGMYPHYDRNGCAVMKKLTTRPVIDRIASTTPRTKYKGEGIALGAWVTGRAKRGGSGGYYGAGSYDIITGQVWCAADSRCFGKGHWWVATSDGVYYVAREQSLEVIGQAGGADVPLFEVAS